MPSWRLVAGFADGSGTSLLYAETRYILPSGLFAGVATEAFVQFIARDSYTLSNLFVRVTANFLDGSTTVRTRKNGVNGNQSVSIAIDATGAFEDTSNTDSLAEGDLFNYQAVTEGTDGEIYFTFFSCVLTTESNNTPIIGGYASSLAVNLTRYSAICGSQGSGHTEADMQYIFRTSAVLSNLRAYISENGITDTSTLRTRINGGNGNQILSIPDSATGAFEDTTNTDNVSVGNSVNLQSVTGASGASLYMRATQLKSTSVGRQTANATFGTGVLNFGLTRYLALEGNPQSNTATEAYTQLTMRMTAVCKNLFVRIPTNSVDNSSTFRTRKNTANGSLSASVPASTTGTFEDTTNSDSLVDTDVYNLQVVTGGTSGSMIINIFGIELAQPAPPPGLENKSANMGSKMVAAGLI